jgi:hypothetical protein
MRLRNAMVGTGELWEYEGAGHLQNFTDTSNQQRLADFIHQAIAADNPADQTQPGL